MYSEDHHPEEVQFHDIVPIIQAIDLQVFSNMLHDQAPLGTSLYAALVNFLVHREKLGQMPSNQNEKLYDIELLQWLRHRELIRHIHRSNGIDGGDCWAYWMVRALKYLCIINHLKLFFENKPFSLPIFWVLVRDLPRNVLIAICRSTKFRSSRSTSSSGINCAT